MSDESKELIPAPDLGFLAPQERDALEYFNKHRQNPGRDPSKYPLSPTVQGQLLELYLQGTTCIEIRKLRPEFGLGQIVAACVDGDWQKQRTEHLTTVFFRARQRLTQAMDESVDFLANMLTATKKLHSDNILKFLQTGKVEDLELSLPTILSMKGYKEVLELLLKLHERINPNPATALTQPTNNIQAGTVNIVNVQPGATTSLAELAKQKKAAKAQNNAS